MLVSSTSRTFVLCAAVALGGMAMQAQDASIDMALAHAKTTYSQQGAKPALREYETVLEGYRKSKNQRGEAITLGLMGNCYKKLGDYPKALSLLGMALEMKRELHDRAEEGRTLSHLGLVYWEQGDYPKAIANFNESIAIARELKDIQLEAAALNNLSLVLDEEGDYHRSLEQYQRALELHRSVNYEPGQSDALGNIGGVYMTLGRYSEAITFYRQALTISERLQLKTSQSQDLGNLAICQMSVGRLNESLETLQRAIVLAREAGDSKEAADWIRARATVLVKLGRYSESLKDYATVRQVYASGGLKRELLEVLADIGNVYLALGDRHSAENLFRVAGTTAHSIGNKRGVISSELAIGELQWNSGDYRRAATSAQRALEHARALEDSVDLVSALVLLGKAELSLHRLDDALAHATQAVDAAHACDLKMASAEALDLLTEVRLTRADDGGALSDSELARSIAADSGDVDLQWRSEYHRGQALEALGKNEDAVSAYRAAVELIETTRNRIAEQRFRTGYLQDKQQVYVSLVRLLLKLGRPKDAFRLSERLREYSYRTQTALPEGSLEDPQATELQARIRRLQALTDTELSRTPLEQRQPAIKTYSEELVDAQRQYRALLDGPGAHRGPELAIPIPPTDIAQVQSALPPGTAILEYVVAPEQVVIFVLTKSGLHATTARVRKSDLRAKVELLRALIHNTNSNEWQKPAASLREILISPVERKKWLAGTGALMLIPHGILHYLPFSVLAQPDSTGSHALIESYELSELPSAASVITILPQPVGRESLVAFAPSRTRLQFAIPEAQEIARAFGQAGSSVVGPRATETRFKEIAGHFQLVHLATHGYFNRVNPIFSGLQLEPDALNDGRLEVHEIARMRLTARLVTLSACDTGLGAGDFNEIPAGDEFVGLNRAFLEAGSGAVLASLWEVNDRSTLSIMRRLYAGLQHSRGSRSLALAQREMAKDPRYRHPFYWAAFVFIGRDRIFPANLAEKR